MSSRINRSGLAVAGELDKLVSEQVANGTGVAVEDFWAGVAKAVSELGPENRRLLAVRDELQEKIDAWHLDRKGQRLDAAEYKTFLKEIGYLLDEPEEFSISTQNVDPEIAQLAGPQLVVPVMNARYALNAANARWGSLYDAFYGTDILPESPGREKGSSYNPARGELVVAEAAKVLDDVAPLDGASHTQVTAYLLADDDGVKRLRVITDDGGNTGPGRQLLQPSAVHAADEI